MADPTIRFSAIGLDHPHVHLQIKALQDGAYNYIVKDDTYLNILPHVVDETSIKFLADREKEKDELEIREKNVALEQANRKLKKLDQMKSDFTASVSHDIHALTRINYRILVKKLWVGHKF